MSSLDQAVETQMANIQAKTGKSLPELAALIQQSGLTKARRDPGDVAAGVGPGMG